MAKQRFKIKFNARWRRKNYDLHNVLGFYVSWFGIFFAITGLVWGFEWFSKGYYAVISGGEKFENYSSPPSTYSTIRIENPMDKVWLKLSAENPTAGAIEVHTPEDSISPIIVNVNPDPSTYWKIDYRYFDQYSLKELSVNHTWGRYDKAGTTNLITRMNYDIHVGAVLGFPGKLFAFFSSLIIASLPITGFMIWWGRRKKNKIVSS